MNDIGLHSHSGIERALNIPKKQVIIDERFEDLFGADVQRKFTYQGRVYLLVPTWIFYQRHGEFKNYES